MRRTALLLTLIGSGWSFAYTIVRTDGSRIEALTAPEYKGGKAVFRLKGGTLGSLPEPQIDRDATERANVPSPAPKPAPNPAAPPSRDGAPKSLGEAAPGGLTKSSFSDDDLARRPYVWEPEPEGTAGEGRTHSSRESWPSAASPERPKDRAQEIQQRIADTRQEIDAGFKETISDGSVSAAEIEEERKLRRELADLEKDLAEARKSGE